jgi:hypothetical protein
MLLRAAHHAKRRGASEMRQRRSNFEEDFPAAFPTNKNGAITKWRVKMSRSKKLSNKTTAAVISVLLFIVASWTLYVSAGHSIVAAMYRSEGLRVVDLLMSGKDLVRLED